MRTQATGGAKSSCGGMLIALAALTATATGAAEYSGQLWGGGGGNTSYNLDCGSGAVMVGAYGKKGTWMDQIGITCRTVNANGTLGDTFTRGPVGGTGGASGMATCPTGWVVGQAASDEGMSFMEGLSLHCHWWNPTAKRRDPNFHPATVHFGSPSTNTPWVRCPDDKVGQALRGKHGIYIDSMRFVCDVYNQ